jgi:hypothetical protein
MQQVLHHLLLEMPITLMETCMYLHLEDGIIQGVFKDLLVVLEQLALQVPLVLQVLLVLLE